MKKPMSKLLLATMVAGSLMQGGILLAQEAKPAAAGPVAVTLDTKLIQDPAARQAVEAIQKKVAAIKGYDAELGRMVLDPNGGFAEFTDELTVRLPDRMLLKRNVQKVHDPAQAGSKVIMTVDGTWLFIQNVPPPPSPERIKNYQEMLKQQSPGGKPYTQAEIDKLMAERVRYLMRPGLTMVNLKTVEQAGGPSVGEYISTQGDPANPFAPYKLDTLKLASETPGEWVLLADWREPGIPWPHQRLTIDKQTGCLKELAAQIPGTEHFVPLMKVKKLLPKDNLADGVFQMQIPKKESPDFTSVEDYTTMWISNLKEQRKRDAQKNDPTAGQEKEKNEVAITPEPEPVVSEKEKAAMAFSKLCETGSVEQLNAAIAAGAEVNIENRDGMLPLAYAARNKHAEAVSALIKAGAKVEGHNHCGWTPLMMTAWMPGCTPEAITALLKCGADVNATDEDGTTPLNMAAGRGSPEVISTLIKAGAKVNESALMTAAEINENSEVITLFLKAGAEVNARTQRGMTPLMVAAIHNKPAVLAALLKAGADVNVMDKMDMTPLMMAAYFNPDSEVLSLLIKAGANVNAKDKYGKSVLKLSRENKNQQIAEKLIKAGAK
jgi:ankyrin repeat protein